MTRKQKAEIYTGSALAIAHGAPERRTQKMPLSTRPIIYTNAERRAIDVKCRCSAIAGTAGLYFLRPTPAQMN